MILFSLIISFFLVILSLFGTAYYPVALRGAQALFFSYFAPIPIVLFIYSKKELKILWSSNSDSIITIAKNIKSIYLYCGLIGIGLSALIGFTDLDPSIPISKIVFYSFIPLIINFIPCMALDSLISKQIKKRSGNPS